MAKCLKRDSSLECPAAAAAAAAADVEVDTHVGLHVGQCTLLLLLLRAVKPKLRAMPKPRHPRCLVAIAIAGRS